MKKMLLCLLTALIVNIKADNLPTQSEVLFTDLARNVGEMLKNINNEEEVKTHLSNIVANAIFMVANAKENGICLTAEKCCEILDNLEPQSKEELLKLMNYKDDVVRSLCMKDVENEDCKEKACCKEDCLEEKCLAEEKCKDCCNCKETKCAKDVKCDCTQECCTEKKCCKEEASEKKCEADCAQEIKRCTKDVECDCAQECCTETKCCKEEACEKKCEADCAQEVKRCTKDVECDDNSCPAKKDCTPSEETNEKDTVVKKCEGGVCYL